MIFIRISGRIVNRFSKDTGAVDELLPNAILDVVERIFLTIGIIIQILVINWWTILPMLVMAYVCLKINDVYISTVQDIKRLEGNGKTVFNLFIHHKAFTSSLSTAKSPVFSLINSSLPGLLTIRSCRAQSIVSREFDSRQNDHTAAHYLVLVTSSAFGFWLDVVSIGFLAIVAYNFILLKDSQTFAGDVGLALTQILTICGTLQFVMKQMAEVVAQMTSVERMFQYTKLEQEDLNDDARKVPWPDRGEIKFVNLCLRYSDVDKPVLKNLCFTIEPRMKVMILFGSMFS